MDVYKYLRLDYIKDLYDKYKISIIILALEPSRLFMQSNNFYICLHKNIVEAEFSLVGKTVARQAEDSDFKFRELITLIFFLSFLFIIFCLIRFTFQFFDVRIIYLIFGHFLYNYLESRDQYTM